MNKELGDLFVSTEIAILAKEKEFDEPCLMFFHKNRGLDIELVKTKKVTNSGLYSTINHDWITLPLYQQLIQWLFKKGYYLHDYYLSDEKKFGCDVYDLNGGLLFSDFARDVGGKYNTIEESWDTAIKEALNFIDK